MCVHTQSILLCPTMKNILAMPLVQEHAIGVNPLKTMMEKVSELAGLSVKYTNHSLQATFASRMLQDCSRSDWAQKHEGFVAV